MSECRKESREIEDCRSKTKEGALAKELRRARLATGPRWRLKQQSVVGEWEDSPTLDGTRSGERDRRLFKVLYVVGSEPILSEDICLAAMCGWQW